jgi:hypothetical protein
MNTTTLESPGRTFNLFFLALGIVTTGLCVYLAMHPPTKTAMGSTAIHATKLGK